VERFIHPLVGERKNSLSL